MYYSNADNLPRQRAKKQAKALNNGVFDASIAAVEAAATTADVMNIVTELAEKVATLEAAAASK